jgi:hypothetical protein
VAALHDVQRDIIDQDARAAGHGGRLRRVGQKIEPGPFNSLIL